MKCTTIINFLIIIFIQVFWYRIYVSTKVNPFERYFEKNEKNTFFTKNYARIAPLDLECSIYEDLIMDPDTTRLEKVFKLNYFPIHTTSKFLLYLNFAIIGTAFLYIIFLILSRIQQIFYYFYQICSFAVFTMGIANLVLNITLISDYFKGNSSSFLRFLKCPNVNSDVFEEYKESVLNANSDIKIYIVFIIASFIYKSCFQKYIENMN